VRTVAYYFWPISFLAALHWKVRDQGVTATVLNFHRVVREHPERAAPLLRQIHEHVTGIGEDQLVQRSEAQAFMVVFCENITVLMAWKHS
jgi:hypothetical protein